MVMIPDPYTALNLPHTATAAQITKSYRQLARKYHPDTWSQPCFSEADKQQATAKFTEISNAYSLLSDATEKADYDRTYRLGGYREEEPPPPPAAASSHPGTKTSNTPRRPPPPPPPPPPRSTLQPAASATSWASAVDRASGRVYYYNTSTGERSWGLVSTGSTQRNQQIHSDFDYHRQQMEGDGDDENPHHSRQHSRIDNHQCDSFVALLLCPPIGLIALYHSWCVDRCWRQGRYGEAYIHAKQAPQYACLAKCLGVGFWIYWIVVRDNEFDFDWPEFDLEGWGD